MTARTLAGGYPPDAPPPPPPAPQPDPWPIPGPGPRTAPPELLARMALAELDGLTGDLPTGADACHRWGDELARIAAAHPLLVSDRLAADRRIARRVAALGQRGGGRHG